jgi:hypothetical protein
VVLPWDSCPSSCLELSPPSHLSGTPSLWHPLANDQKPCMASPSWPALYTSHTPTYSAYKANPCPVGRKSRNAGLAAPKTTTLPEPPAPATSIQMPTQATAHYTQRRQPPEKKLWPPQKSCGASGRLLLNTHQKHTHSPESTIEKRNNNSLVTRRCIQGSHAGSGTLPVLRKYAASQGASQC